MSRQSHEVGRSSFEILNSRTKIVDIGIENQTELFIASSKEHSPLDQDTIKAIFCSEDGSIVDVLDRNYQSISISRYNRQLETNPKVDGRTNSFISNDNRQGTIFTWEHYCLNCDEENECSLGVFCKTGLRMYFQVCEISSQIIVFQRDSLFDSFELAARIILSELDIDLFFTFDLQLGKILQQEYLFVSVQDCAQNHLWLFKNNDDFIQTPNDLSVQHSEYQDCSYVNQVQDIYAFDRADQYCEFSTIRIDVNDLTQDNLHSFFCAEARGDILVIGSRKKVHCFKIAQSQGIIHFTKIGNLLEQIPPSIQQLSPTIQVQVVDMNPRGTAFVAAVTQHKFNKSRRLCFFTKQYDWPDALKYLFTIHIENYDMGGILFLDNDTLLVWCPQNIYIFQFLQLNQMLNQPSHFVVQSINIKDVSSSKNSSLDRFEYIEFVSNRDIFIACKQVIPYEVNDVYVLYQLEGVTTCEIKDQAIAFFEDVVGKNFQLPKAAMNNILGRARSFSVGHWYEPKLQIEDNSTVVINDGSRRH